MKSGPVDPRLLRYASASRWFFAAGALAALIQTLSMIGSAWFATDLIVTIVDGRELDVLGPSMVGFAVCVLVRAVSIWLGEVISARGGARVTSQLRLRVVDAVHRLGPGWLARKNSSTVTTIVSQGLDALEGYFSRYLPQLILTVVATPIVVAALLMLDLTTGIIVIVTLPIIPIFMVLIGWATQAVQKKQWMALTRLASSFLEVVAGLSTLTIFGRQHRQATRVAAVTEEYRTRTMAVLRVSFLSSFVLELAGSLSVALVAVSIGVRLVEGQLALVVGLFALLLTPEAYLPLRQVGAQFHAAAEGVAAAESVFEILDEVPEVASGELAVQAPGAGAAAAEAAAEGGLTLDSLSAGYDGRSIVDGLTAQFLPGRLTVIAGPSGTGKSTLVAALLGFTPATGSVRYLGKPVSSAEVRELTAWAGQQPALMEATVAENIALGWGAVDEMVLREAMQLASAELIDPWQRLGVGGSGLSGGQAQRVALARAIYRSLARATPIIILDEPSAALDVATEGELIRGLRQLASIGRIVIVVSHRPAFFEAADSVLELRRGLVSAT